MPTLTLSDTYGDDIEINYDDDTGAFSIEGLDEEISSWDFEAEDAKKLVALLTGSKKPTTVASDGKAVLASEVSFNEGLIRFAGVHDREVAFTYVKTPGSPVEHRRLKPTKVTQHNGHVNFFGYDPDRGEVRQFRSDRIRGEVTL